MNKACHFNSQELLKVDEAVKVSEELINNYFKMSSGQWLKNRYDIKTAKDLADHENIEGPFAQVIKYEGRKKDAPLGSSSFSFYKVCLQDCAILSAVSKTDSLFLDVVRFLKFKQRYENRNEADVTLDEERRVHFITHKILKPVPILRLSQVFEFYKDWILFEKS